MDATYHKTHGVGVVINTVEVIILQTTQRTFTRLFKQLGTTCDISVNIPHRATDIWQLIHKANEGYFSNWVVFFKNDSPYNSIVIKPNRRYTATVYPYIGRYALEPNHAYNEVVTLLTPYLDTFRKLDWTIPLVLVDYKQQFNYYLAKFLIANKIPVYIETLADYQGLVTIDPITKGPIDIHQLIKDLA